MQLFTVISLYSATLLIALAKPSQQRDKDVAELLEKYHPFLEHDQLTTKLLSYYGKQSKRNKGEGKQNVDKIMMEKLVKLLSTVPPDANLSSDANKTGVPKVAAIPNVSHISKATPHLHRETVPKQEPVTNTEHFPIVELGPNIEPDSREDAAPNMEFLPKVEPVSKVPLALNKKPAPAPILEPLPNVEVGPNIEPDSTKKAYLAFFSIPFTNVGCISSNKQHHSKISSVPHKEPAPNIGPLPNVEAGPHMEHHLPEEAAPNLSLFSKPFSNVEFNPNIQPVSKVAFGPNKELASAPNIEPLPNVEAGPNMEPDLPEDAAPNLFYFPKVAPVPNTKHFPNLEFGPNMQPVSKVSSAVHNKEPVPKMQSAPNVAFLAAPTVEPPTKIGLLPSGHDEASCEKTADNNSEIELIISQSFILQEDQTALPKFAGFNITILPI